MQVKKYANWPEDGHKFIAPEVYSLITWMTCRKLTVFIR